MAALPAAVLAADIIGTPGPDVLEGTPDADTLDGRGGADVMMGLPGNDTYIVGQVDDEVLEGVGDGTDTVRASVSYTLSINVENLTLAGDAAIDGTGNDLNNRLTGNGAANTLNGRAGADRMFGRGGNDTFVVDAAGDVVNEAANGGTDAVRSSVTHTLRSNVENLVLTGTAAANGTGNELANSLRGNGGANTLRGLAGDDMLSGGGGNDRLIGGPGNDQLSGGPGQDEFQFDTPLDTDTNQDRIVDFNPADDVMRLIGEAFPTLDDRRHAAGLGIRTGVVAQAPPCTDPLRSGHRHPALRRRRHGAGGVRAVRDAHERARGDERRLHGRESGRDRGGLRDADPADLQQPVHWMPLRRNRAARPAARCRTTATQTSSTSRATRCRA